MTRKCYNLSAPRGRIFYYQTCCLWGQEGQLPRYERQSARPMCTQHFNLAFKRHWITRMAARAGSGVSACGTPVRAACVEGGWTCSQDHYSCCLLLLAPCSPAPHFSLFFFFVFFFSSTLCSRLFRPFPVFLCYRTKGSREHENGWFCLLPVCLRGSPLTGAQCLCSRKLQEETLCLKVWAGLQIFAWNSTLKEKKLFGIEEMAAQR